ncbi:MAG: 50S ribosomal protein L15 [Patescibacteria group bacterium]|nr:50S ribosomal protein L15 [Patescibacteria group bacterium]MDE2589091.1 50S ribosomal protein L15 [Patescibacteria group bacterium]
MNLHALPKTTTTGKRRLGQGHGSGRVKTSGRGQKGQKARRKIKISFEGGALPLIKRMPFLRGKGRNYALKGKPELITLTDLNVFAKDAVVDIKALVNEHLVKATEAEKYGVKVLGDGTIEKALRVKLPTSKSAKEKIEKAGGSVELSLNE